MKYNGPHKVIFNRNDSNLGIPGHVNRIFEIAHGELVIFAAGDDISLPERVQTNYQAWETLNRKSLCIFSGISAIDKQGNEIKTDRYTHSCSKTGTFIEERYSVPEFCSFEIKPLIVGGAAAWSPRLLEIFGPLPDYIIQEDEVLSLRTACLGSFTYIPSPLIKYRLHDKNIFASPPQSRANVLNEFEQEDVKYQFRLEKRSKMFEAFILDLETAKRKSLLHDSIVELAIEECNKNAKIIKLEMSFYKSSFLKKCRLLYQLKKMGLQMSKMRSLFYMLFPAIYRSLKLWRNHFNNNPS